MGHDLPQFEFNPQHRLDLLVAGLDHSELNRATFCIVSRRFGARFATLCIVLHQSRLRAAPAPVKVRSMEADKSFVGLPAVSEADVPGWRREVEQWRRSESARLEREGRFVPEWVRPCSAGGAR